MVTAALRRAPSDQRLLRSAVIVLALAVVVVAALTAIAVVAGGPTARDRSVTAWIAEHRTDGLVWLMEGVTFAGSGVAIWCVAALCVVAGVLRSEWGPLRFILPTALIASLITNLVKAAVDRERPPSGIGLRDFLAASFPSGHATTAAALWGAVAVVLVRSGRCLPWTGVAIWASFALAVDASRLVLGAHWLTDVLAGTGVGTACVAAAVIVSIAASRSEPGRNPDQAPAATST